MKSIDLDRVRDMVIKANFVYIVGNGGSASTANHFANDLVKMCGIRAVSLCSNEAIVTAFANDNGYENIFVEQLKVFLAKDDLLITISGSGTSKNIVKALEYAKKVDSAIVSFPTMFDGCTMQEIEDLHLAIGHKLATKIQYILRDE